MLDWSQPQDCWECGRRMRAPRTTITDFPGTAIYSGQGVCQPCRDAAKRAERRKDACARTRPKRRGGNPTVAELAAQGHPCIEPAPVPSRVRTYPL